MLYFPLLALLITFILWLIYGKNKKINISEELEIPKTNIIEVMYLFKKETCDDISGLMLIELCNKGFIKIIEQETTTLFNSESELNVVKVKDYDANDYIEQIIMNDLFLNSNAISLNNALDIVYKSSNKIKDIDLEKKYFCKTPTWIFWLIILMIIAIFFVITYIPISKYGDMSSLLLCFIFPSIGFSLLFYTITSRNPININYGSNKRKRLNAIIFGLLFASLMGFLPVLTSMTFLKGKYLMFYLIGLGCIFIMIYLSDRFIKRNELGNEIYTKIVGFKLHLTNTVINDTNYFYNALPYIYIFKLQNRYLNTKMEKPLWYDVSSYDMQKLNILIIAIMDPISNILSKKNK